MAWSSHEAEWPVSPKDLPVSATPSAGIISTTTMLIFFNVVSGDQTLVHMLMKQALY